MIVLGGGRHVDALLLSSSAERLRVVMPGGKDTAEFRLIEGRWTSENGVHVEVGAILAGDEADARQVLSKPVGRAQAAV
jgi:hypothetical protein